MNEIIESLTDCITAQAKPGDIYTRLTVKRVGRTNNPRRYYAICDCECGKTNIPVQIARLKSGSTKSCGCFNRDQKTKHGLYSLPIYQRWATMMDRCFNTKRNNFSEYGGRGITVCERWKSPENFILDMSASFSEKLQLDRIDTNGNYCPENCRWVSQIENLNNRRNTVMISYNGETKSIREWSELTGISKKNISTRYCEYGWSAERTLTTPALSRTECAKIANAASQLAKNHPSTNATCSD